MITRDELVRGLADRKVLTLFGIALLSLIVSVAAPGMGVAPIIISIALIGMLTIVWRGGNVKIAGLALIVFLSLANSSLHGIRFGIDFSGGVRIPLLLERPVTQLEMDEMVQTIKTRASTFALTEVRVSPVGDSAIYVEVPQSNPEFVKDVEKILSTQGVYFGVVDGKVAIRGDDIFSGTIARMPSQYLQGADWGVTFQVTEAGAQKFSQTVKGKADFPLYMFLDRPTDAIIVVNRSDLLANTVTIGAPEIGEKGAVTAAGDALRLSGGDIRMYLEENFELVQDSIKPASNTSKAIVSSNASAKIREALLAKGFVVVEKPRDEMQPRYSFGKGGEATVSTWRAIGLLSSPRLAASVTEGVKNYGYTISGPAEGVGYRDRSISADRNAREIESILKGGALPVQMNVGSATSIPAPLGAEFLRLSAIGAVLALIAISIMVGLRYHTLKVVLPIVFISISEIIILVSILGSFTIDLAGMAGIIAAIGVSVDAQIVVTDELLKKESADMHRKLEKAFSIIVTNVIVATIAMLPLMFSGLVEIIGFAQSTILGALLGVFISRPAYGAIVEKLFE
jgi:preprotein translocase subunit SecD